MTEERVTFATPSESTLRADIDIKAAPERVYDAWTKPEILVKWFGPRQGGHLEIGRFEPQIGGVYDLTMVFSDGDRAGLSGEYRELDPPRRLVFTWHWDTGSGRSEPTLVTVDLAPSEKGTLLTLTHDRFLSIDDRDQHQSGWDPILVRLASVLAA